MRRTNSSVSTLALGLLVLALVGQCYGQLKVGFYKGKCGKADVEEVIFRVVKKAFAKDPTLAAALLRMQFHDCFVRGCDASILLDVQDGEKTATPNSSVRGYEVIDAAKAAVEKKCPGVVSCADIIIIATRVTVYLARGNWYYVETGRRDGLISRASDAKSALPPPNVPVPKAVSMFGAKKLSTREFVLLLGAHTVGIAHCPNFEKRLYNFSGIAGKSDPSMSSTFLPVLKKRCPRNGPATNFAVLDQVSPQTVDNGYFKSIKARKGVLQVDQDLAFDPLTKSLVSYYAANNTIFNAHFGIAMMKLGRVEVLTGTQGQIRKSCGAVNKIYY